MSLGRTTRGSSSTPLLVLGPLLAPLSLALLFLLSGWLRALSLVPLVALALAVVLERARRPRGACHGCAQALQVNAHLTRSLSKLQETLAHELRNPVACLKGLTGLVALEPHRAHERIDVLKAEILRMEALLDEHLTFARPLTALTLERTSVDELLESVVHLYAGLAHERAVELSPPLRTDLELECDPGKVKLVLMGLVHNAIDASPAGAAIELCAEREDGQVLIKVLDRGPGVPSRDIPALFEPGVTTKPDAAGLGLTLSRAAAEQHGGRLSLRNRSRGGLEAVLALPLAPSTP